MRRLLAPSAALCLLLSACASGTTSTGVAESSAAPSATTSEAMTSEAMTSEAMTSEATTPEAMTSEAATSEAATSEATTEPSTAAPSSAVQPTGTAITTASSDFGEILFDGAGQAIYLFDKETSTTPECYDDCAVAWPPVLTDGAPAPSGGVTADLLGTTLRTDGSVQVTYAGHPLYYYAGEGPNEVTCHNVDEFGGLWLVVTPSGAAAA